MKQFTAKTLDEAIALASEDQNIKKDILVYEIIEEKKSLFKKTATIAIYELSDAIEYAENYLKTSLGSMGIQVKTKPIIKDEIVTILLDTDQNPVLIGKNGKTLQALTELTRLAVRCKFKKRYHIMLDINNYKVAKYKKISYLAKSIAKEVLATKNSVKLDPMTSDERRIIHNVLSKFNHIVTESTGEGKNRAIVISYTE